ncbi:MAG: hypothetical protein HZC55_08710 [Verrucomicrobia bacterium]|nr:hypothetical protein [Verrucomicrobiota bacterium]
MPWSYAIDAERDLLLVKATGVFSDLDLQAMRTMTTRDPRFHPGIRALFDYLGVSQSAVTYTAVVSWPMGQLYGPASRRAILIGGGLHEKIAAVFRDSIETDRHGRVLVTRSRDEAVAWLNEGVSPEKWME